MAHSKFDTIREKLRPIIREQVGADWIYHPSHGQKVYEIKRQILLHLPASSRPGWWGVNSGVLNYLNKQSKPWSIVFLLVDDDDADDWVVKPATVGGTDEGIEL